MCAVGILTPSPPPPPPTHTHTHTHRLADELFTFNELTEHLEEKKKGVTKLVTEAIPLAASDWFLVAKDKATYKPKHKDSESEEYEEPSTMPTKLTQVYI